MIIVAMAISPESNLKDPARSEPERIVVAFISERYRKQASPPHPEPERIVVAFISERYRQQASPPHPEEGLFHLLRLVKRTLVTVSPKLDAREPGRRPAHLCYCEY